MSLQDTGHRAQLPLGSKVIWGGGSKKKGDFLPFLHSSIGFELFRTRYFTRNTRNTRNQVFTMEFLT